MLYGNCTHVSHRSTVQLFAPVVEVVRGADKGGDAHQGHAHFVVVLTHILATVLMGP